MPDYPIWLDGAAISAGALFGAVTAVRRHAPIVGILTVAVISGLGGGMLRDLLLGLPVAALHEPSYLPLALVAALAGIPLYRVIPRTPGMTIGIDAFVLGLFVVAGTEKAMAAGVGATQAVFVGFLTGIGGGTMADLLYGERPVFLQRGRWYATAAVLGAIAFIAMHLFLPLAWARVIAILLIVLMRELSERLGWDAPTADVITRPR